MAVTVAAPTPVAGPSPIGTTFFAFFISTWVFAQFLPLVAIYMFWRYGHVTLLLLLAAYLIYRRVKKPVRDRAMQQRTADFMHKYPYFRTQKVVLEMDEMPKPNSNCLFSFHMHGVLTCGSLINGVAHPTIMKSDASMLVGSGLFGINFLYDLLVWHNFKPWTREVMKEEMAKGANIITMPGGFEEASCYKRDTHRTYIKDRKGWIKYALQFGYKIYPCYTFGEERTYHNWQGLMKYRLLANKYQLPGAVFLGRWCTWMPLCDVDLVTVIGTPLEVPHKAEPTNEDIDKYHKMYLERLTLLFDTHKKDYAHFPDAKLEIVGPDDFGYKE